MSQLKPAPAPFFAIRHKPTGFLIPAGGKGRRGHTHQEPSATRPPRLLINLVMGMRALKCYTEGKWTETTSVDHNGEYDSYGPEPRKGTQRNPSDFELVEVWLKVKDIK